MVTEDAVVDVIEGLGQVHAGVGQGEAVAMPQPVLGQDLRPDTVDGLLLQRDQVQGIELVGRVEQHAAGMAGLALGMIERPGRVVAGDLESLAVICLRVQPGAHLPGEDQFFVRRRAEVVEALPQGVAVERLSLVGLDLLAGAALHELPFDGIERGQLVVPFGERPELGFDAEQAAEEILEIGPQVDEQGGLLGVLVVFARPLAGDRGLVAGIEGGFESGVQAGDLEALGEVRAFAIEAGHERGIEARQSVDGIEIVEREAVGQNQIRHAPFLSVPVWSLPLGVLRWLERLCATLPPSPDAGANPCRRPGKALVTRIICVIIDCLPATSREISIWTARRESQALFRHFSSVLPWASWRSTPGSTSRSGRPRRSRRRARRRGWKGCFRSGDGGRAAAAARGSSGSACG